MTQTEKMRMTKTQRGIISVMSGWGVIRGRDYVPNGL